MKRALIYNNISKKRPQNVKNYKRIYVLGQKCALYEAIHYMFRIFWRSV